VGDGNAHSAPTDEGDRYYSPLVKSLAEKHGLSSAEMASIKGTGQGGRVSKNDLLEYVEKGRSGSAPQAAQAPAQAAPQKTEPSKPAPSKPAPRPPEWDGDGVQVVAMDNMRQAIADHMVRSKHTSPHVYSIQEVDCTAISKYRAMHKKKFEEREGFGLSFTPFFLEAAVKALVQFPYVNASVDGKKIILKKNVNLGCAVALGNTGLIVPVIKRAEERNFVGIARSLSDLAARARNKKLSPDDVSGGTFTVTNPGVFGTMIGTPIINQPQVAILCLGAIKKRPVVINDMIAIREICYLTLSYDHRIVDGSLGGQFLAFIREYLENWDLERALY
jgi:2-oxoglutarate dehydrogenase E2 component (dihydrolipoamide succinyltransferase)